MNELSYSLGQVRAAAMVLDQVLIRLRERKDDLETHIWYLRNLRSAVLFPSTVGPAYDAVSCLHDALDYAVGVVGALRESPASWEASAARLNQLTAELDEAIAILDAASSK